MKSFSASWVFPISSPPIKNGVVTIDDSGMIVEVSAINHSAKGGPAPGGQPSSLNHLEGILVPGFINTHCHLELSHLKGKVSEKKGMTGFISELIPKRGQATEQEIKAAIAKAEEEMFRNGIVAVGDISNTAHSFEQKAKGNLYYHTFIELFDLDPAKAREEFRKGLSLQAQAASRKLQTSIVPHAPYTVTPALFALINELAQEITCIHSQESQTENDFFEKKGELLQRFRSLGIPLDWFDPQGKNSLQYILPMMSRSKKIQFVHNTYTTKEDLHWLMSQISHLISQIYFCTCPNANLYIENKLPDYNALVEANAKMTIGTDSYASNWSLSILDELKTIHRNFSKLNLETLLTWATLHGAGFLGIEKTFGSLEKGKKPGLVLIRDGPTESPGLVPESKAVRIA